MTLSSCLIGEDSLVIQCGNILIEQKCTIERVVSTNSAVKEWAEKNSIICVSSLDQLLKSHPNNVDYIFSVVNSYILTTNVLKIAKYGAINYHDSYLPKYAGLNSTTWAILNDEKEHGITWHIINEKIDEGDIVKQVRFPIYPDDTAFTLNLRCYEHAIQSFSEMLIELINGCTILKKQDLIKRSYYGKSEILPNLGFIDWQSFSAELIVRIIKATSLGHYNNNVGLLKIFLKKDYLIIPNVTIAEIESFDIKPGVILLIDEDAIYISTITKPIKIDCVIDKRGRSIDVKSLVFLYNLQLGLELESPGADSFHVRNFYKAAMKKETYWLNQLKNMADHHTFSPASLENKSPLKSLHADIKFPEIFSSIAEEKQKTIILASIMTYLFRLNNYEKTSVSLAYNAHTNFPQEFSCLFSTFLPYIFDWGSQSDLEKILEDVSKYIKKISQYHTFFTDIALRHPSLENIKSESDIIINILGYKGKLPEETLLYFEYDKDNKNILIMHRVYDSYHSNLLKDILLNLPFHIETIIHYFITKPHVKISEFCFLNPLEREKLLMNWGQGDFFPLPEKSIIDLFLKNVFENPQKVAIYIGNIEITYSELDCMSDQIAFGLKKLKLASQSLIGIYINRSVEMLSIILGILKADCVYVPLDTKYPMHKIETIANEAQLSYLITTRDHKVELSNYFKDKQIINFYTIESILSAHDEYKPLKKEWKTNPNHLAYIMFTSGTTGTPKGVVVTQKNVINYCFWFVNTTHFTRECIIDFSSSIAFDLSIPCTIAPLISGGSIAICNEMDKMNPEHYLNHLKKYKITHTELTPGYIEMLLHYPNLVKELIDLKYLLLGADTLYTEEVMKWLSLCPHQQIVNEYGPTETTVSVTSYFINKEQFLDEASVPIGRPGFNTSTYILDKYKNLCPIGMKGELYIGGAQVTNGYLRKPILTEEKFIPSALDFKSEILYRTGDLAGWLPGGYIQFFGRNDFQVKIQGYRIELPAIESVLLKMPAIDQAIVIVRQGNSKEKYLRAYLVSDNTNLELSNIKTFLSEYLPSYMIPKEFCIVCSIPLKENEKINFDALENQPCKLLRFENKINTELSDKENIVLYVWKQAFNNNNIDQLDDFFDIGGDSLIALQIISELKQQFKIDIPLYYLFEYRTVSKLSPKIEQLLLENDGINNKMVLNPNFVIQLSTGSFQTPLFLIHPVGGSVLWYKQLADNLSGELSIYGIQDPSIDGHFVRFKSLEEMAACYIEQINTTYDGDNIAIAGASFGATVAFEIATQLIRKGKKVNFLGIIDGWAIYPDCLMQKNSLDLLSNREDVLHNQQRKQELTELEEYRKKLLFNYQLSQIPMDIVLYKAAEIWDDFIAINDLYNGWGPFTEGKIINHIIPGNHETMLFKPNVTALARQLSIDIQSSYMKKDI